MSDLRQLLHQLADAVADHLEHQVEGAKYYTQNDSPLGARAHCRLVRRGALPGFKRAGLVLVERAEMHRFIEGGKVVPRNEPATDEDAEVERLLDTLRKAS